MKITFKDLKQNKFTLDFDPSEPVSALKAKVHEEQGWEPSSQKLIYSGKILKDDDKVEAYNIEEKGFVVCVVNKPKPAPAPAASSSATPATPASAATSTPASAATSTPAAAPAAPLQSGATAAAAVPATPTPAARGADYNDPNALAIGDQRAEAIANMEAMGFERSQIDLAMRAAFFNPDRAVEYLLNGIPENLQQQQPAAQPAATQPAAAAAPVVAGDATGDEDNANVNLFDLAAQQGRTGGAGGARGGAGAGAAAAAAVAAAAQQGMGGIGSLDFLRHNPQFQQLRQVVQQQPQMLEPLLQSLGAGNPQLANLIASNPDQFLGLLGEAGEDDAPLPPGAHAISVTEEERDAIERLCRLGFDRDQAIQAYFACDKNEELAANFLFDQPDDDEAPPPS